MSDVCLNCDGLIMEPNISYGYSGKICYCPPNPATQYQRPSLKEKALIAKELVEVITGQQTGKSEISALKSELASLKSKQLDDAKTIEQLQRSLAIAENSLAAAISALEKIANGVDESLLLDEKLADAWTDLLNLVKEAHQALREIKGDKE